MAEPPCRGAVALHTSAGTIGVALFPKESPKACRNMVQMALEGRLDNCPFHRVVPGFVVQTGDVDGRGAPAKIAFVAGVNAGRVLRTDADGNFGATNLFPDHPELPATTRISLTPQPDFLPLRSFAGRALTAHGDAAYYDLDDRIVRLAARPQRRFVETGLLAGLTFSAALPGTVWHRLVFDGCIPPGGSVWAEARAADDPHDPLHDPEVVEHRGQRREEDDHRQHAEAVFRQMPDHDRHCGQIEKLLP